MKDVIIGTAGHIDHGKTTLLKALTGIDADRLQEEKRRGITIDLGFAHLQLGTFRIGFVDVPGHERFVKNMLAGIGGIKFVLLVVAADESIMPQTVEHFQICKLLEVPDGLIVITKKDLVEPELLEVVREEVAELVAGSFLEGAPAALVDSVSGEGVQELKALLKERLNRSAGRPRLPVDDRLFRLPVDRVFSLRGFGTVVTGTPAAGRLGKDAPLQAYPAPRIGKVRGIQIFNEKQDMAIEGQRAALNLSGLETGDLRRGMTLGPPSAFRPSHILDAFFTLLPDAPATLKQRSPIRFHQGSGEVMGRIYLLEGKELAPGSSSLVQLRLDQPVVCCMGDHYVVRRYSPMRTLGGGFILDNRPPKRSGRHLHGSLPELRRLRRQWSEEGPEACPRFVDYYVRQTGLQTVSLPDLGSRTGLTESALLKILDQLPDVVVVGQEPGLAVSRQAVEKLKQSIVKFLETFHAQNPLAPGASQEEIKRRFLNGQPNAFFQYLLQQLRLERRIEAGGGTVRLRGSEARLNPDQETVRDALLGLFDAEAPRPAGLAQIVAQAHHPASKVEEIYYYLIQTGDLVRVSGDAVLSRAQARRLETTVRKAFRDSRGFGVAEFKELFGVTRKYAIPLLEYLDRRKITRRVGDQRIVL